MDTLTGIICGLFFVFLVIFAHLVVLFLVQGALVALMVGVGCIFSSYVRDNRGRLRNLLETAIKYRLVAIPGVMVFDSLVLALFSDSTFVNTWIGDEWAGWLALGLLAMATLGLAFLLSFWGKTKRLTETHNRVLAMEAILSCYLCWIGTKMLIGD